MTIISLTDILFFVLQYGIYSFLAYKAYQKFIRPQLILEQQDDHARATQLQQRHSLAHDMLQNLHQRADYLKTLFAKIKEQNQRAQLRIQVEQSHQAAQAASIQQELKAQQEKIAQTRKSQQNYALLAPEIKKELELELRDYYKKNNKEYLKSAISKLHQQAQGENKL